MVAKRKLIASCILAVILVHAPSAGAQLASTGTIAGRVVDIDGVPLPGARVTVSGAALIGERITYAGANGGYQVILLPAGNYRVAVQLTGFTTVQQERLEVGVRRTTSYDVVLELSSVQETVTVVRSTPLIDVRSTKRSSELPDEIRNRLPEYRGEGADMMSLSPDASIPNSGNFNGTPSFFGAPPNATAYQVDGATVSDPSNGGQFTFYGADWFDTVEIATTGAGAEFGKATGAVFNVVTKSGGNDFHGESNFFFRNDALTSDNTAGIESTRVDFTPAEVDHNYDLSLNFGGPIVRDRAWFFAGYQGIYESGRNPGGLLDSSVDSDRFFGKLTWQADVDNRLIGSVMGTTYTLVGPSSPFVQPEAGYTTPSFSLTPNVTWDRTLSDSTFFEAKYSGFYGYYAREPFSKAPFTLDWETGTLLEGNGVFTFDRSRTDVQANLSHYAEDFAGRHSLRAGVEWERLVADEPYAYGAGDGLHYQYFNYLGQPYLAYAYEPYVDRATSDVRGTSVFLQDDWTVGNRTTLNLGLRYDHWDIGYLDAQRPDEPTFNDLAPRLGINFDVFGDARASLYAFYGRFFEEPHGFIFSILDPNRSDAVGLFWNGTDWEEFFRSNPISNARIDPDLTNMYSDQVSAGLDYELFDGTSVGGRYVHKRDVDIIGSENEGNDYVPVTVTNDDGNEMTIFAAHPSYDPSFVVVNNPSSRFPDVGDAFREYNGFQLRVNRRFADGWAAMGSLMIQKATGNVTNRNGGNLGGGFTHARFDSPNDFVNTPGELPNSRRYVLKLLGTWQIPDPIGVSLGGQLDWASSARWSITERFGRNVTNGLPGNDRTVPIRPIGSETIEPFVNLNLRVDKRFTLQPAWGELGVIVDIFNLFNADTVRAIEQRVPDFGEPTAIVRARQFRIGLRWLF